MTAGEAQEDVVASRSDFPVPPDLRQRGITLRLQRAEDEEMQRDLFVQSRWAEFAQLQWDDAAKYEFLAQQSALQQHHYTTHFKGAEFYTVLEGQVPIGRLYIDRVAPREIRLVDIIFFEPWRGQGIGTAFIQALQALAQTSGRFIGLHVEEKNPARQLYLRRGFCDVEPRPPYIYMTWNAPGQENVAL
jgi:GNAT superfamily N-acetyltransferase